MARDLYGLKGQARKHGCPPLHTSHRTGEPLQAFTATRTKIRGAKISRLQSAGVDSRSRSAVQSSKAGVEASLFGVARLSPTLRHSLFSQNLDALNERLQDYCPSYSFGPIVNPELVNKS